MCAFAVIKLGDIIDSCRPGGIHLALEPQGDLLIEVIFFFNEMAKFTRTQLLKLFSFIVPPGASLQMVLKDRFLSCNL